MHTETVIPRDAAFFYEHAGFPYATGATPDEQDAARRENAAMLADAHAALADAVDAGTARVVWEDDADPDMSVIDETEYHAGNVTVLSCILYRQGPCGHLHVVESLGGIDLDTSGWSGWSGRDPYCDVVEAELAFEAGFGVTS
jgi:hypothetical protein